MLVNQTNNYDMVVDKIPDRSFLILLKSSRAADATTG